MQTRCPIKPTMTVDSHQLRFLEEAYEVHLAFIPDREIWWADTCLPGEDRESGHSRTYSFAPEPAEKSSNACQKTWSKHPLDSPSLRELIDSFDDIGCSYQLDYRFEKHEGELICKEIKVECWLYDNVNEVFPNRNDKSIQDDVVTVTRYGRCGFLPWFLSQLWRSDFQKHLPFRASKASMSLIPPCSAAMPSLANYSHRT